MVLTSSIHTKYIRSNTFLCMKGTVTEDMESLVAHRVDSNDCIVYRLLQ